ncbi:MAG: DHH family phosphoesterase, partial [Planctomycetota bacterium]
MPRRVDTRKKLAELRETLGEARSLLIVLQDGPDPDAIAAGVALRRLANACCGISTSLASGGEVGRAENRALIRYLGLNIRPLEELPLDRFAVVAMVDTQPGHGNTSY